MNTRIIWPALFIALVMCSAAPGEDRADAELKKRIAALIVQLDDDAFEAREGATLALIALGEPAVAAVTAAAGQDSAEVKARAGVILAGINEQTLTAGFQRLAREKEDAKIDLEEGMWLLARLVDPKADRKAVTKKLDEMAATVRQRLGKDVDPAKADPKRVVDAIRQVVFTEEGFKGWDDDSAKPQHSAIDKVLASKRGLPILLSHVVVSVGDRLGVPMVGMPVPGRYMCKYDGSRAPGKFPREDIMLDPFGGGSVVTRDDIRELLGFGATDDQLKASSRRDTLIRMLNNVQSHYAQNDDEANAARAEAFIQMLRKKEE
jgi:regulator of sirC expression with transglutaminase-like and TPR domain